jgi:hypothetical protein
VTDVRRASDITLGVHANRVLKVEHIKLEVLISNGRETTPGSHKICTVLFALQLFQKDHLKSIPPLTHKTLEPIRAECSRPCS